MTKPHEFSIPILQSQLDPSAAGNLCDLTEKADLVAAFEGGCSKVVSDNMHAWALPSPVVSTEIITFPLLCCFSCRFVPLVKRLLHYIFCFVTLTVWFHTHYLSFMYVSNTLHLYSSCHNLFTFYPVSELVSQLQGLSLLTKAKCRGDEWSYSASQMLFCWKP